MSSSFRIFSFFLFSLSLSFVVLRWYSRRLVGRLANPLSLLFFFLKTLRNLSISSAE